MPASATFCWSTWAVSCSNAPGCCEFERDVDAVRVPSLGQQLLGRGDVALQRRQLAVIGLERGDMEIAGDLTHPAIGQLKHLGVVGSQHDRLADADVVERLLVLLHADAQGLGPIPPHRASHP